MPSFLIRSIVNDDMLQKMDNSDEVKCNIFSRVLSMICIECVNKILIERPTSKKKEKKDEYVYVELFSKILFVLRERSWCR